MKIKILATGGTFDKEYNELNGELFFKNTHLNEILTLGRSHVDVKISTLMMKDSLDMTQGDREIIAENCIKSKENNIVITHGTDTMVETATYLHERNSAKTIVLTGAFIPYKFGSSDGLFNLGAALAYAQVLPPGVYISMHGKCFDWNAVRKNRETGRFEKVAGQKL